jgi:hypothetical protein
LAFASAAGLAFAAASADVAAAAAVALKAAVFASAAAFSAAAFSVQICFRNTENQFQLFTQLFTKFHYLQSLLCYKRVSIFRGGQASENTPI